MTTRSRCILCTLAAVLLAGCVVAPSSPPPPAPPPPPPRELFEDFRRCRADNQRAHAEVFEMYSAASRSGRISAAEAQQFQAMEARLRNLRIELARDGLSMRDCQRIAAGIARERDEVARMARPEPGVALSRRSSRGR